MLNGKTVAVENSCSALLPWLSGMFDGDGCFYIRGRGSHFDCYAAISSNHQETAVMARRITGLGNVTLHRRSYRWAAYGKAAVRTAELLKPYLYTKRAECALLCELGAKAVARKGQRLSAQALASGADILFRLKTLRECDKTATDDNWQLPLADLLVWCSGLFDAEGSISIAKSSHANNWKLHLQLSMSHAPSVYNFSSAIGCGTVRRVLHKDNRQNSYVWTAWSNEAKVALKELGPWIITKRECVDIARAFADLPRIQGGPGLSMCEADQKKRTALKAALEEVNRRL